MLNLVSATLPVLLGEFHIVILIELNLARRCNVPADDQAGAQICSAARGGEHACNCSSTSESEFGRFRKSLEGLQGGFASSLSFSDFPSNRNSHLWFRHRSFWLTPPFTELSSDPTIRSHLAALYDTLLEQNLLRIVEPYSTVEIEHVAEMVGQGRQAVETKYVLLFAFLLWIIWTFSSLFLISTLSFLLCLVPYIDATIQVVSNDPR